MDLFGNLGIDWKMLLAQAINFLLVLWLLNRFVFKKIIHFLEERKERISQGLELTEKAKREIERIDEARHRKLEEARKEAEGVLNESRSIAAEKEKEVLSEAREKAEGIVVKAKEQSQREKFDAVTAAKDDIRKLSSLMAEKILSRSVKEEDEEKAAKEVMDYFEKNYANAK